MQHVMLICHARTGGTWVGQLLNASPRVKFLWEPDYFLSKSNFLEWDFTDMESVEKNIYLFKPHVDLKPKFEKKDIDTAVYKLITILGEISYNDFCKGGIKYKKFINARNSLSAKVIHLIRHPVRWAASIQRWGPRDNRRMKQALRFYTHHNLKFFNKYKNEAWYALVKHEDLVMDTEQEAVRLCALAGITASKELSVYINLCHTKDSSSDVDLHDTIMKKETVLNRWKDFYKDQDIISYANRLTSRYWPEFYDAIVP